MRCDLSQQCMTLWKQLYWYLYPLQNSRMSVHCKVLMLMCAKSSHHFVRLVSFLLFLCVGGVLLRSLRLCFALSSFWRSGVLSLDLSRVEYLSLDLDLSRDSYACLLLAFSLLLLRLLLLAL